MGTTPRPTVELDPRLYRALKRRARGSKRSLARLVNDAVREALRQDSRGRGRRLSREDAADIAAILERRHERSRPLDDVIRDMKRDGLL